MKSAQWTLVCQILFRNAGVLTIIPGDLKFQKLLSLNYDTEPTHGVYIGQHVNIGVDM